MVKRNTTSNSQKEYDDVWMEYGKIVKGGLVSKYDDGIPDEVWNVYIIQKIPDPKLDIKKCTLNKE